MAYYTVGIDRYNAAYPYLLFDGRDTEKIVTDPILAAIFPDGCFVQPDTYKKKSQWDRYAQPNPREAKNATKTIVASLLSVDEPDTATLDTPPICYVKNGVAHSINLRDRYNRCLSLFKAVGCSHCPDKGAVCLSQAISEEIVTVPTAHPMSPDDWLDRLKRNKTTIAGYEFIDPSKTRTKSFADRLRPVWEHDFGRIAENTKLLSERASNGAETKKFKKTECVKCVVKDDCNRAKHCPGAYPPEKEIIDQSLDRLAAAFSKSSWPEWQLWEVARAVGEKAKVSRWNVVLTGLTLEGSSNIVATVHRAKGSIDRFGLLKTYEEIAKTFKLCATEQEALDRRRGPVKDFNLRAILWLTLATGRGHQAYGWGCSRYITGVGCTDEGVKVMWTNGSWISSYLDTTLRRISDVHSLSPGSLGDIHNTSTR